MRGCLLGVGDNLNNRGLDGAVDRFIHAMGNHLQLLNFVSNSLAKDSPASRKIEVLSEAVGKVTELTRSFSQYIQLPSSWLDEIDMVQVLELSDMRWEPAFREKGVTLEQRIEPSIEAVSLSGDPFFLEQALGHILQNALEATDKGGRVEIHASADEAGAGSILRIEISDSGSGIAEKDLEQVLVPFFTTKRGRNGLGLAMANRSVQMHSGFLRIKSVLGQGTDVEIILPGNNKIEHPAAD